MKLSLVRAAAASLLAGGAPFVHGCSRVFQNKYDRMVAGRSMDWGFSFEDVLFLNPPGQAMDGGAGDLSVTWTSKYGSVTSSIIGFFAGYGEQAKEMGMGVGPGSACPDLEFDKDGSSDGINSEGLSAHLLYLGEEDGTVYAEPSTTEPVNLSYWRWVRYVLDNFATVEEAVEGMKSVVNIKDIFCPDVVIKDGHDNVLGAHMAIEDASGDSAVFEHVGGTLQVYHSKTDALVMTNEPPYNEQKEILKKYEPWGGNITLPDNLPGSVASPDRLVRLEYYLQYTPEPKTEPEALAYVNSLLDASNVPFGAPYNGGVYPTWWTSLTDVTDKVYYFNWLLTPGHIWVELEHIDWTTIKQPLYLLPQNMDLDGDVFCDFITLDGEFPLLKECGDFDDDEETEDPASAVAPQLRGVVAEK